MKDLTKTMEITMKDMDLEDEEGEGVKDASGDTKESAASDIDATSTEAHDPGKPSPSKAAFANDSIAADSEISPQYKSQGTMPTSPPISRKSTPRPQGVPTRQLLMDRSEEEARMEMEGMTEEERELKKKEKKKGGLSKEQREELAAYEAERRRVRQERVDTLARKLLDRISVWTETDKGPEVTHAFNEKTKYEVENLKMESFGIDILHGRFCLCTRENSSLSNSI